MNKKIWLTGALCIAAIFITVFIYNNFYMDVEAVAAKKAASEVTAEALLPDEYKIVSAEYISLTENSRGTIKYSNDVFSIEFSSDGGTPVSLKLNDFRDLDGSIVEMIFSGDSGLAPFSIHDGGFEAPEIIGLFEGRTRGDDVIFTGLFADESGNRFEIVKTYNFVPGSYMFRFKLAITPIEGELPLGNDDFLYSIGLGPQLGPEIEKLDRGYIYRYFCLVDNGEKRNVGTPDEELVLSQDTPYKWLGMEGRYFANLTVPGFDSYSPAWDERSTSGLFKRNTYYLQRPVDFSGRTEVVSDTYYMYFGPKDKEVLSTFNTAESNAYGLSDLGFEILAKQNAAVELLSSAVQTVLNLLHRIIPNYGLNIILFVLIIQAIIFPVSRRTYDNAIRMQLLGPEIGELKTKYKFNDQKRSEATIKLFQENGVKPHSSMVPFIIHLPFFIMTYVLLLTNIDFRLETFIPGLINDIALPDYIFDFSPTVMPITAWDKIRLLPIIALAVSLIQSRYIQAPADSIKSMRVMSYLVPVVMFLVIYNMPSGAVLYWITMMATNLLLQWRIKIKYATKK